MLLYSNNLEKITEFITKALNEYYGLQIHLKFLKFKGDYMSHLFVSGNKDKVEESYNSKVEYRQINVEKEKLAEKRAKRENSRQKGKNSKEKSEICYSNSSLRSYFHSCVYCQTNRINYLQI